MKPPPTTSDLPEAILQPERRWTWLWLLPAVAVLVAAWMGANAWAHRGQSVTVHLDAGHGLSVGADVRYNGIVVGQVRSVELDDTLDGVVVTAVLTSQPRGLARAGTRFWVVRPQLNVTGATGLETVVGPRYLAMLPGEGPPRRHFMGLSEPPVVDAIEPGDLEVILESPRRGGLRPGTPVLYRQVPVGTVLSVGLSSDAAAVEARVHVPKAYAQLVRAQSRFWNVGGFEAELGFKGMSIEMDSVEALLAGGVALATPPDGGAPVRTGHRFELFDKPRKEWLDWRPQVMLGSPLLPPGGILPAPIRAVVSWNAGRFLKSQRSRRGWVLQTEDGLLGPADLLTPPAEAAESLVLEVAGRPLSLPADTRWVGHGLALLDVQVKPEHWPRQRRRRPTEVEDCVAIADPTSSPLPLAAARLQAGEHTWTVDPVVSIDEVWHGAVVLSRADGKMIGVILVASDAACIALLPAE